MAFQGSLHDIALPDILQLLASQTKSGYLTLRRDSEAVRIGIVDGMAVDVDAVPKPLSLRLGTILVNTGHLGRPELKTALATQRSSSRKLGQILVGEGRVSAEIVRRAIALQFTEILYSVLTWNDGSYDFERAEVDYDRDNVQPTGFQGILMDCMRMMDEWPQIEKRLAQRATILRRVPRVDASPAPSPADSEADPFAAASATTPTRPSPEEEELSPLETEVLARIDGQTTIQQVIDRSLHLEFDVCRAIFDLWEKNLIAPAYEGRLSEVDLPDLLLAIRRAGASGQLELEAGGSVKSLTFVSGRLEAASSSDPDDALGLHLLRRGTLTRRELEMALGAGLDGNGIVKELERLGRITSDDLAGHEADRMARIARSLFSWREGTWRYRPGTAPGAAGVGLDELTPGIVAAGLAALDVWSRITAAVGPTSTCYTFQEDAPVYVEAVPAEARRCLRAFAGGRTVEFVRELTGVSEFALHQAVWLGRTLGLLAGGELGHKSHLFLASLSGEAAAAEPAQAADPLNEPDLAPAASSFAPEPSVDFAAVAAALYGGPVGTVSYGPPAVPVAAVAPRPAPLPVETPSAPYLAQADDLGDLADALAPDDLAPDDVAPPPVSAQRPPLQSGSASSRAAAPPVAAPPVAAPPAGRPPRR